MTTRISSKKKLLAAAAAAATLALAAGAWFVWMPEPVSMPDPGKGPLKATPRFELKDDQGKARSLEELRGKVVVVHFWATWCAPCIEEIPQWVELARKFRGKPVAWVAISLDQKWEEAHRYLDPAKLPDNVISLLDPEAKVPDLFGSFQFPESYLVTPDLKILSKWVGPQDWEGSRMTEVLDKVVELTLRKR